MKYQLVWIDRDGIETVLEEFDETEPGRAFGEATAARMRGLTVEVHRVDSVEHWPSIPPATRPRPVNGES